jgi:hypothetical protein
MDGWFMSYCLSLIVAGYTTVPRPKAILNGDFLEKLGRYSANAAVNLKTAIDLPQRTQRSQRSELKKNGFLPAG